WGNSRVQKFSADGEFLAKFEATDTGVGAVNHPSGVAVDSEGDSVVVDGFGWLLKGPHNPSVEDLACYLPILNSTIFEDLVSALSWRLQGGQLRLEPKYIKCVPLPRVEELPTSLHADCRELGMRIAAEGIAELSREIESIARDCYGRPELVV
ncbi:MAG: hypothetical protein IH959_08670, partial [Chloroflexi bacterium]|nr:hypothetical protein [Chloroflexota bacterium]